MVFSTSRKVSIEKVEKIVPMATVEEKGEEIIISIKDDQGLDTADVWAEIVSVSEGNKVIWRQ